MRQPASHPERVSSGRGAGPDTSPGPGVALERLFDVCGGTMGEGVRRVRLVGVGDVGRAVVGAVVDPHLGPPRAASPAAFRVGSARDLCAETERGWSFVIGHARSTDGLPASAGVDPELRFLDAPRPSPVAAVATAAADVAEAVVAWVEAGAPDFAGSGGTSVSFACGRGLSAGDGSEDWFDAVDRALAHPSFFARPWWAARTVVGRVAAPRLPDPSWMARLETAIAGTFYTRPVVRLDAVVAGAGVQVALVALERGPPALPAERPLCMRVSRIRRFGD